MKIWKTGLLMSMLAMGAAGVISAASAEEFPSKPITLVVPYSAGGGTDTVARELARDLEPIVGQKIVVVNKTGGSGAIGTNEVANAKPDGYTLLINDKALISSYHLGVSQTKWSALEAVARLDAATQGLVVGADSAYKTLESFIAAAKKNPGKLTIGVSGTGGMSHLLAENIKIAAGIDLKVVAFDGGAQSRTNLLGGHVDSITAQLGEVKSLVDAGKLKFLAFADLERNSAFPDVPTFHEKSVPFDLNQWRAIWVPKDTPKDRVQKLSGYFKTAMETDGFKKLMGETQTQNLYLGPDALTAELEKQDKALEDLVRKSGLK